MPSAATNSKKRSAATQSGPKSKKPHLTEPSEKQKDKGKKRSHPVTAVRPPSPENSEESEEELQEDADGLEEADDLEGEPSEPTVKVKDPNAARESHKAQRATLEQRRAAKPHSALLADAKRAWAAARQKNLSRAERTKNIRALMDILRGNVKDIVAKHDASRIVQTVVKHGGQAERNEVAEELKGHYKTLAQSKYSKFLVTKLVRFCPAHRPAILREFQGHILKLLLHREASGVLADAFELHANAYERALLLRDFYGKEANLVTLTAGSEAEKESARKGLNGLLDGLEGERRKRVLGALKDNLVTIFNNPDKGAVSHAIVHRALWEYLTAVNEMSDEAEREKARREMFESCQDVLAEMVHTKDGSRVVREFIVQGTAKDRKIIVKAIKPHVERMCKDDEAQLVLFTALDVIDDTKLTAKSLVADIVAAAPTLCASPQGRRALIYLVAPRTRRHFTPAQIVILAETDAVRASTSKKDSVVRTAEIRKAASDGLLEWVAAHGAEIMRDPGGSLVLCEVMLDADGDKASATTALLTPLAAPYPSPDPAAPHPITLPHTARLFKTLLQGGHFSHATRAVEPAPRFARGAFAASFVGVVGREAAVAMAKGDGAFVVAALCEALAAAEGLEEERKTVRGWFGAGVKKEIGEGEVKGGRVLLESLEKLG